VTDRQLIAPFAGTVIAIARGADEPVGEGEALVVLEAMKMEHEVITDAGGVVRRVEVEVGQTVEEGQLLAVIEAGATPDGAGRDDDPADLEETREDLSPWPDGTTRAGAPRARTSMTWSTRTPSSSMGR